jgi:hypothetical protein
MRLPGGWPGLGATRGRAAVGGVRGGSGLRLWVWIVHSTPCPTGFSTCCGERVGR